MKTCGPWKLAGAKQAENGFSDSSPFHIIFLCLVFLSELLIFCLSLSLFVLIYLCPIPLSKFTLQMSVLYFKTTPRYKIFDKEDAIPHKNILKVNWRLIYWKEYGLLRNYLPSYMVCVYFS